MKLHPHMKTSSYLSRKRHYHKIKLFTCLFASNLLLYGVQCYHVDLLYSVNQHASVGDWHFSDTALACFIPVQMVLNSIIFFIIYSLRRRLHLIAPLIVLSCAFGIFLSAPSTTAEYKTLITYSLTYLPAILLNVILLLVQKSISPAE